MDICAFFRAFQPCWKVNVYFVGFRFPWNSEKYLWELFFKKLFQDTLNSLGWLIRSTSQFSIQCFILFWRDWILFCTDVRSSYPTLKINISRHIDHAQEVVYLALIWCPCSGVMGFIRYTMHIIHILNCVHNFGMCTLSCFQSSKCSHSHNTDRGSPKFPKNLPQKGKMTFLNSQRWILHVLSISWPVNLILLILSMPFESLPKDFCTSMFISPR